MTTLETVAAGLCVAVIAALIVTAAWEFVVLVFGQDEEDGP